MQSQALLKRFIALILLTGSWMVLAETRGTCQPISPKALRKSIVVNQEEWRELRQGKIIVHAHEDQYLGGNALAFMDAPAWKVWQVITDYPQYHHVLPRAVYAEILSIDKPHAEELHLKTVFQTSGSFHQIWNQSRIQHWMKDPKLLLMQWQAEKTNLKENQGYWLLEDHNDKTLVMYQIKFNLEGLSPESIKPFAKGTLEGNLRSVRSRLALSRYQNKPEKGVTFAWSVTEVQANLKRQKLEASPENLSKVN